MTGYVIIGFVSGIISGMGIGGGTLLIPMLIIIKNMNQQTAQNINLIYFIPTAIISIITHKKNNNIQTNVLKKLIIFGIIGAVIGSFISLNTEQNILRKIFGGFLLVMGILELKK